jgi:hypothetical protein
LQSLFWDLPFYFHDQFLPGVLTSSVSSSLLQPSLTGEVTKLGRIEKDDAPFPIKLSFPNFPRLRALKVGLYTAHSLSVPELVDAAPNLYVLEMKGMKGVYRGPSTNLYSSLWRRTDRVESVSHPKQHPQLRIFCTDIPAISLLIVEYILSNFPNLVEVRLGSVQEIGLDPFLNSFQSTHPKLQRLSWISKKTFTLEDLFRHLIRLPEQLPAISSYSLGSYWKVFDNVDVDFTWPDRIPDMEILANILLSLPPKSDSALAINLLLKSLSCLCIPEEESAANDCKPGYLQQFIRRHNLNTFRTGN